MTSAGGYIQAALEQAPNPEGGVSPVSSNLFYVPGTTIEVDPKPTMLERDDELRGGFFEYPNAGVAEYNPEGSLEGRLYPGLVGLLLSAACGGCVSSAGDGAAVLDPDGVAVPVGAYRHVFSWRSSEIPQTLQLLYAPPAGGFWKASGVGLDELALKASGGAQTYSAKLFALVAATLADPGLTPSYEAASPWRAGEMELNWLSGSAVTEEFEWSVKNGLKIERAFTTNSRYPDAIVYEQNLPTVSGTIPKRSLDADDWEALVAGTQFAARMHYVHSQPAAGAYRHQLWVELPGCQYQGGKADAIKNERRNKASFDWAARYDEVSAGWATLTLVNSTPTYATYA